MPLYLERHVLLLFPYFPKDKKPLSHIIEQDKQTHTCEHGEVILNALRCTRQHPPHQRFCNPIGT